MTHSDQRYAWIGADYHYQSVSEAYALHWQFDHPAAGQPLARMHTRLHAGKLEQLCQRAQENGMAQVTLRAPQRGESWRVRMYWHPHQQLYLIAMHSDERSIRTGAETGLAEAPLQAVAPGALLETEEFRQRLAQQLERNRIQQSSLALICIDLDRFQWINDTLGSEAGTVLLNEVADRLRSVVRSEDLVARFSGDTFVLMVNGLYAADDAETVAHRVVERLSHGIYIDRRELFVSASAGVAIFPQHGRDESSLLRSADLAMYAAKRAGRNTYCLYYSGLSGTQHTEAMIHGVDLKRAISAGQLTLQYCPVFDNSRHRLCGAELLAGWQHPQLGWQGSAELMPAALQGEAIPAFNEWLWQALLEVQQSLSNLPGCDLLLVHLEEPQILASDFITDLEYAVRNEQLLASQLVLELDAEVALAHEGLVFDLQELGFRVCLRGVNAVLMEPRRVHELQPDWLKLDAAHVQSLNDPGNTSAAQLALAAPTIALMAEGVSSAGQLSQLINQGCALMQGRYFSELLTLEQLSQWMTLEAG
ncbi:MAG: diguanylate cyclase [Marinobacterium sp.]|nr:diguanylate cyclase [Marinobacterium sp.]